MRSFSSTTSLKASAILPATPVLRRQAGGEVAALERAQSAQEIARRDEVDHRRLLALLPIHTITAPGPGPSPRLPFRSDPLNGNPEDVQTVHAPQIQLLGGADDGGDGAEKFGEGERLAEDPDRAELIGTRSAAPIAVRTKTGMSASAGFLRCSLRNVRPSMTGIMRSSRIRDGAGFAASQFSASRPCRAAATWYPSSRRSSESTSRRSS